MASKKYKPEYAKSVFHRYITGEEDKGEHRAFCPVCEDPLESKSPSASFNFDKGVWNCQGKCAQGGSVYNLAKDLKDAKGFNPRAEAMKARNAEVTFNGSSSPTEKSKPEKLTEDNVKAWHRRLINSAPYLSQLMDERGFTKETIREFQVGWDGQRYTIPVRDEAGELVNVRRYKMKVGPKGDKMLNIAGAGTARIFNIDTLLKEDTIVITEGETDCMLLNQFGVPAITHTAGAATFKTQWGPLFQGKTVYICYDNDDGGRTGATKAGKVVAPYADQVYQIEIPLPDKGADITDFLHKEGHTETDFKGLMASARPMNPTRSILPDEAPKEGRKVSLEESMAESHQDETLEMTVTVAGKQNPPYRVPKRFNVSCAMNKGPVCQQCPVFFRDGDMNVEIAKNDPVLFKFVGINDDKINKQLKTVSGALCTDRSEFNIDEDYYMEELVVGNSVDEREAGEDQKPVTRTVYSVSTHATEVNTTVHLVGKNVASPKDQRLSFMAWELDAVNTSLDNFVLHKEIEKGLYAFQVKTNDPDNQETPLDRCFEIAADLSANVTRIYGRDLLHVAYDLIWHSPLAFDVEGRRLDKGWLEAMVVGDTRTGKSETAIQLSKHYRAGVVKSCEGATFAGLVGGVQQVGSGNWMTTWGVIPLNDRRLVVLDEVSGLKDKDVIENMSSIRSSGLAQIVKIDTQETSARTRLIWIGNPSDGMMIDEKPGVGIDALRTLVHNQEDIARFDFVLSARASEVDSGLINQDPEDAPPHVYTQELCSNLVLWAWSLQPDQIKFTDSAVKEARKIAQQIGEEYVADPPLLQTENARFKLYRISAAIAARTFHIKWPKKDQMILQINRDHVRAAKEFLDMIYDNPGMEYRSASRRVIEARKRAKKNYTATKAYLIENMDTVLATLRSVQQDSSFKGRDFEEFGGMTRDTALAAVSTLQRMGMIHRKSKGYIIMDKQLVKLLRELEAEDW